MPFAQAPGFVAKISKRTDVPALALMWLIASGTRSNEARGARWSEVDRDKREWRIHESRMKGGEMHIVPLNPFMLGVLDKCARRSGCDLLFPGPGGFPISDTSLRDILREHQIKNDDATLHGFRSTFRDWAAESGIADDVAEACIAHRVTVADDGTSKTATAVERAYRRTTHVAARVDVMARWGKYIDLNRDAP